jgi:uncharacterized protein (UPF0548 family)
VSRNAADGSGHDLTYAPVGATRGAMPEGFHHLRRSRQVGEGAADFDAAAEAVRCWRAQRVIGVRVEPEDRPAREGAEVRVRLGLGPVALSAPARVVYVVDEPRRRGFAYGTLPGHPLLGEEAFVVHLDADGSVVFTVTAYSRAGSRLTRLAGPVLPLFQRVMARRYLRAIERAVQAAR